MKFTQGPYLGFLTSREHKLIFGQQFYMLQIFKLVCVRNTLSKSKFLRGKGGGESQIHSSNTFRVLK